MLTFEKVIEIFGDFLDIDKELEILSSRYGYICISFDGVPTQSPYCQGKLCRNPEEMFEYLISEYQTFAIVQLTNGRRDETKEDRIKVGSLCQKYFNLRDEAVK